MCLPEGNRNTLTEDLQSIGLASNKLQKHLQSKKKKKKRYMHKHIQNNK